MDFRRSWFHGKFRNSHVDVMTMSMVIVASYEQYCVILWLTKIM